MLSVFASLGSASRWKIFHSCFRMAVTAAPDLARLKPLVAVVQMTSTPDKEATFSQLSSLVERAKSRGADMVFMPEAADYMSESREQLFADAEPLNGPTVGRYRDLAKRLSLWLSIGGFHEKPHDVNDGKRTYNTHLIIDSGGDIKGIYRKVHLFDVDIPGGVPAHESSFTLPGSKIGPPVNTPCGKVGMAICYDMRFPELGVSLAQQGAEILTYPSAFTIPTGMAHWDVLLRNRAIENQCYVIAAAQVGRHHAKRSSYGNSLIVDPWGVVLAKCHDTVDVCVAEIDLELLARRRREMPIFKHKRHDVYGQILQHAAVPVDDQLTYHFAQMVVPSSVAFYRSALSVAFVNRKPVVPGHVLVCPVRVAPRLADLTSAEVADLFTTVQAVSNVIQKHHDSTSLTISVQDGPDAGQTVKHVHVHILPRKAGDFANNDEIYVKLESHDKNVKPNEWRSDDDMAVEAAILRSYFSKSSS